ncbi:MAG: HD domain-containing protein [Candidatus Obscuribacterales bacterium]|nr:HD domain-containing protein [Candidatus Obscuribacterales bacterium]
MILTDLPKEVETLLKQLNAPPRLIAHLQLVHDVSVHLVEVIRKEFPTLTFDIEAVKFGAATHDIGKVQYTTELTQPGNQHEEAGEKILKLAGYRQYLARFATTHGGMSNHTAMTVEDLLVRTADTIWKGKRNHSSEMELVTHISNTLQVPQWQVYLVLDETLCEIAATADLRLRWQFEHSTVSKLCTLIAQS